MARPTRRPDVDMWTFGLHGGARLPMGGASVITPYLNYDYVDAKLKGFTENGVARRRPDGRGQQLEAQLPDGRRQVGDADGWRGSGGQPRLPLPVRRRTVVLHGAFNGDTDLRVRHRCRHRPSRGTFLAGVSVGGKIGPVDIRIGYEGEFNGDITSHTGNFKVVVPLGGRAAPPPPVGRNSASAAAAGRGSAASSAAPAASAASAGRAW